MLTAWRNSTRLAFTDTSTSVSPFPPANLVDVLADVNALASGLADGSAAGDWRLPNLVELESLVDVSSSNQALTPGHPFTNVSNAIYWSSTSYFGGESGSPGGKKSAESQM